MNDTDLLNDFSTNYLKEIVGANNVLTRKTDTLEYLKDWSGSYSGEAIAIVKPGSTDEVSKVIKYCREKKISIVPQGGRTGLCGGGVPIAGPSAIVLSLMRMNTVRNLDIVGRTIVVEAGMVLEALQNEVAKENLLFPLMFGAKGSCSLGGNLATNAGGSNVVKYGTTRELCIGIEAVMPDGAIINALTGLRKDNSGYDIKNLLIGSEGTLGVITAAVFKLFPQPLIRKTAFLSLESIDAALLTLNMVQDQLGDSVEAFEYVPQPVIDVICLAFPHIRSPLDSAADVGVLLEVSSCRPSDAESTSSSSSRIESELFSILEKLMKDGLILDAVIAASEQQRNDFWRFRESVLESINAYGPSYHFDISLPLSSLSTFLHEADLKVHKLGFETLTIGHLGDGNLHYALANHSREHWDTLPINKAKDDVLQILKKLGGSFSAEHGIGVSKIEIMQAHKDPAQLNVMQTIKSSLDPDNLFNPGKLLPFRNGLNLGY